MNINYVLDELKKMGTAQNAKIYKRHGAGNNLYGVSFSDLKIFKNRIKNDQELAEKLWKTENVDARSLATMIAEPENFTRTKLDRWLFDISYYMLIDLYVANVVSNSKFAKIKMEQWIESRDEWVSRAGWQLLTHLAMGKFGLPNIYFTPFLKLIPSEIQKAPNRTRDAMNNALIAIGLRNDFLEKRALSVAGKIGPVEVDLGETHCKTPSATEYINRVKSSRRRVGLL